MVRWPSGGRDQDQAPQPQFPGNRDRRLSQEPDRRRDEISIDEDERIVI
jgi:hypothetical protein